MHPTHSYDSMIYLSQLVIYHFPTRTLDFSQTGQLSTGLFTSTLLTTSPIPGISTSPLIDIVSILHASANATSSNKPWITHFKGGTPSSPCSSSLPLVTGTCHILPHALEWTAFCEKHLKGKHGGIHSRRLLWLLKQNTCSTTIYWLQPVRLYCASGQCLETNDFGHRD